MALYDEFLSERTVEIITSIGLKWKIPRPFFNKLHPEIVRKMEIFHNVLNKRLESDCHYDNKRKRWIKVSDCRMKEHLEIEKQIMEQEFNNAAEQSDLFLFSFGADNTISDPKPFNLTTMKAGSDLNPGEFVIG